MVNVGGPTEVKYVLSIVHPDVYSVARKCGLTYTLTFAQPSIADPID